ncbi:NADPH:quinone reductase [Antrihabitans spumae]|uniref:NADPH:quinone reductase n=1 Tax=Antrihabitans spumae TaxID=3373370 RepID=A0ABW7JZ54_9NOCA
MTQHRMAAAFITCRGSADNIVFGELAIPTLGPKDVLVRVSYAAVNAVDTFVRSGAYRTSIEFPFVVGRDAVGTVVECGSAVVGFEPGMQVWSNSLGYDGRQGSAAEYAAIPMQRLYRLPDSVDPAHAAALAHPVATAYLALRSCGLRNGDTVVVSGAAGNVGSALVAMAVRIGARVVATAAAFDAHHCRSIGADVVLDSRDPDLSERIAAVAPGGADVFVATHPAISGTDIDLLAERGRLLVIAGARTQVDFALGALYMRSRSIHGFAISTATPDELAEAAAILDAVLVDGTVTPRRVEVLPLAAAAAAHKRIERDGQHGTRILLEPGR